MEIQRINVEDLFLDTENPRFGLTHQSDENDALRFLLKFGDLKELWHSFAKSGFLPFEPLVACKNDEGTYTVIEGNRRLAAIKTLLNPERISGF